MIVVNDLTLTYPGGKGVFDLNFTVKEGEVMGYLGPNGAGKTTTIRALLGFMRPDKGSCSINNLDCNEKAADIQSNLGYIPGEISFIDGMSGYEFLKFMHDMRRMKRRSRQQELLEMFELNPEGKIKKFSKGMKQKLGIVAAFMHDPDILVLDEPTSGLDPLMQVRFVELILHEKARGKTILMSSHSFEETERTCDNILIIKEGRIISQSDIQTLKGAQRKGYILKTADPERTISDLRQADCEAELISDERIKVYVAGAKIDQFVKITARHTVSDLDVINQTLEDAFLQFYGREEERS